MVQSSHENLTCTTDILNGTILNRTSETTNFSDDLKNSQWISNLELLILSYYHGGIQVTMLNNNTIVFFVVLKDEVHTEPLPAAIMVTVINSQE